MKQKLDEMERLEQEYREVKNQGEILRKYLEEIVNEECSLERIDCNPKYFQKKFELKILSKKLRDVAIEQMDKYVLGCDNEVD